MYNIYRCNGVKQGGCLSPNLFGVYLNKLIEILRNCNIGCRYGNHYMGVYCYADDLSLLSPTFTGLQEMLKICELYANNYDIIFNAKKVNYYTRYKIQDTRYKIFYFRHEAHSYNTIYIHVNNKIQCIIYNDKKYYINFSKI